MLKLTIEGKIKKSIYPGFYVRSHGFHNIWTRVTNCVECGLRGHYHDLNTLDPCPDCGGKIYEKHTRGECIAGRWVEIKIPQKKKWYHISQQHTTTGYWLYKGENE